MDAKKYLAEFIGTFFLVLTIGCTVIGGGGIPPLAIGAALMVMVYAGGHVSGAHYNPAVTIAIWIRGRCSTADVGPYIGSQVLGASAAALIVNNLLRAGHTASGKIENFRAAFAAEVLFTFALAYVVLNVATSKRTAGNSFYGLAIGMTVMAGAFAVGNISGGVFNPAVAVGLVMMKIITPGDIWLHIVAELAAAIVAALSFKFLNPTDR